MSREEPTYAFGNALQIQRERLRALEELLDPGTIRVLGAEDVDAAIELCDDPGFRFLSQLVVTARGRRG